MKTQQIIKFFFLSLLLGACTNAPETTVSSPDGNVRLLFSLDKQGAPSYQVIYYGDTVVYPSALGVLLNTGSFEDNLSVLSVQQVTKQESWDPVWGQFQTIASLSNEMSIDLQNKEKEQITVIFRIFNDGVGIRYRFPGNTKTDVLKENTAFVLNPDNEAWWSGIDWEGDEHTFMHTLLKDATTALQDSSVARTYGTYAPCPVGFNTPLTMKTPNKNYVVIHEAALLDYPAMSLCCDSSRNRLHISLPSKTDIKATVLLPFSTPWRVILLGREPGELITSNVILNLNEPNKLTDLSYIRPMKYVGVWWEMHVKKSDWDMEGGRHGATTKNVMKYIDFAAENGIGGVLVEGWNVGWKDWKNFKYSEPYPDFNMDSIAAYAKLKNIALIGHHETGANVTNYIAQMDSAYAYYKKYGIHTVKTGYVGIIPDHYHFDQFMVQHYNATFLKASDYQIAVNIHEPVHPTGLSRTYPNLMTGEGMRGQEYNAWSKGNDVSHNVILPFTRNLAGPMDFTPGIFDIRLLNSVNKAYKNNPAEKQADFEWLYGVRSTLAHQLALYVVFYSPLQMVADLPENYVNQAAFEFIKEVPVDWADTRVLSAAIGEQVVIARKEKGGDRWFIGGIAGDKPFATGLNIDFVSPDVIYEATVYADGKGVDWKTDPIRYVITRQLLHYGDLLDISMGAGGGVAIILKPTL